MLEEGEMGSKERDGERSPRFGVKSWEFGSPQRGITWRQGRAAIGEGMKTKEKRINHTHIKKKKK